MLMPYLFIKNIEFIRCKKFENLDIVKRVSYMGENNKLKLIDEEGKRIDGRKFDELRPIKIEANVFISEIVSGI